MANAYFDGLYNQPYMQQQYAMQQQQRMNYLPQYPMMNIPQQPQQQQQQQGERLIFVGTYDDISKVQVPAASSIWVMATNDNVIGRIETDEMGLIKSRKYCSLCPYNPEQQQVSQQLNPNDYVTRAEYNELLNSLKPKKQSKKEEVKTDEQSVL